MALKSHFHWSFMEGENEYKICSICEEPIKNEEEVYYGDFKTHYEDKPLCERCYYEDEPIVTVMYGDDEDEPKYISSTMNNTEGEFWAKWHSTDPWRGYFEVFSDGYSNIFSDSILSYHESEEMLKKLNDKVIEKFIDENIDFCRTFARTSNVFSTGYDMWVKKEPLEILKACNILFAIKKEVDYDNPIYSTGIIMGRDEFKKLQEILGKEYQFNNDNELLNLMEKEGDTILKTLENKLRKKDGNNESRQ